MLHSYSKDTTQLLKRYYTATQKMLQALHDCAVMQWSELHVGCTLLTRKVARRPFLTGYYSATPDTEHGHAAVLGVTPCSGGVQGCEEPPGAGGALLTPHPAGAPPPPAPAAGPARAPGPRWRRRSCGSTR